MLHIKLALTKAHLDVADSWLCYAERKAYETGFEEYKALVVQILSLVEVHLL